MTDVDTLASARLLRPTLPQPGERPLDPVRRFVNSRIIEEGVDELAAPASAAAWLERQGYDALALEEPVLAIYREVRESVRRALNHDGTAVAELNRAMARYLPADPRLGVTDDGLGGFLALAETLEPRYSPLQWILASLWRGAASGELSRLKVCADDRCQIAFYDSSRNRSRAWCTAGGCGNRNRLARHRARRRGAAAPADA